jgi:molecular chaperone DnaK
LAELKAAHESKDLAQIDTALATINEAWKVASEEMYAAQGGAEGANPGAEQQGQPEAEDAQGDNVEDVDFEEVK